MVQTFIGRGKPDPMSKIFPLPTAGLCFGEPHYNRRGNAPVCRGD